MIDSLLPEGIVAVRADADVARDAAHPDEFRRAETMGPKRRHEFLLGRACARRALSRLIEDFALLSDADRAPIWPDGIVGSITHSGDFCAAAVAHSADFAGLGIDAASAAPLSERIVGRIANDRERARLEALPSTEPSLWGTLLFSAKESLYKCYFPNTRTFLGFRDAEVEIDRNTSSFCARLCREDAPSLSGMRDFRGRFYIDDDHVVTALAIATADGF